MTDSFQDLLAQVRSGVLRADSHRIDAARIAPLTAAHTVEIATLEDGERSRLRDAGLRALRTGRLGRLILNGGMATRFGGGVKALAEVFPGKNFLTLKLEHMTHAERELDVAPVPVALLTSFNTHDATGEALDTHSHYGRRPEELVRVLQSDMPRIDLSQGYAEARPLASRSATGHGDFLFALYRRGIVDAWLDRGISHIDFSNIDNLGATLDPVLLGRVIESGAAMVVEVARKEADKGGAACLLDGTPTVLEGPYFPPHFEHDQLPLFNTNNLWLDLRVLRKLATRPTPLPWHLVEKRLDGQRMGQFERFAIDLCRLVPSLGFITVPRDGLTGRFFPIKTPTDLETSREALRERLG